MGGNWQPLAGLLGMVIGRRRRPADSMPRTLVLLHETAQRPPAGRAGGSDREKTRRRRRWEIAVTEKFRDRVL